MVLFNCITGVMVSVLAACVVDGVGSSPDQVKPMTKTWYLFLLS
jgi:hypothetical protein